MRIESYYDAETKTQFERCTFTAARRAFNNGAVVIIAPVNANMNYIVHTWLKVSKDHLQDIEASGTTFKQVVNEFTFYNCNNEMGTYCKYFIER